MGESACLMQQPFSYSAGLPSDAQQGNPLHGLGQSVSFGRFMSEKLDWEKWSTFSSSNRYVEEAEKYSRPGSVAQKKAFFEAHYKKLAAARKAAEEAMLEQEQKKASENSEDHQSQSSGTEDSQTDSAITQIEVKSLNVDELESGSVNEKVQSETRKVETDVLAAKRQVLAENSMKVDTMNNKLEIDNNRESNVKLQSDTSQKENHSKHDLSKIEYSSKKEKDPNAEKPLLKASNTTQLVSLHRSSLRTMISSSPSYGKPWKLPEPKAKPSPLPQSKKETCATPFIKKSMKNSAEKTRLTPKSSNKSYSFTPGKEFNRLTSIIRKIDGSRATSSGSKASKDCLTPMQTPNKALSRVTKNPLVTPLSENRRGITTGTSSTAKARTGRAKWNFLPTEKKLYSPSCFTPFSLRTEERAERRKKKLEEKFKATEAQKQQRQAAVKEKTEKGPNRFQQSLCFKARPLPSFYKERGTLKKQMQEALLPNQELTANVSRPDDRKINIVQNKSFIFPLRSQTVKQKIRPRQRDQ